MNFLGHAVLSFGDTELLTGNMIADHVKGRKAVEEFPAGIAKGIMLHRKIDEFTDTHNATSRAKLLFRGDYGLYSGAIIDSLYDHFLANDPAYFPNQSALKDFARECYKKLDEKQQYLPSTFANYFPYMKEQDWLSGYRNIKGMHRPLEALQRRAKYMADPALAYEIFIGHYYQLAQCYYDLMDDIVRYVKVELSH